LILGYWIAKEFKTEYPVPFLDISSVFLVDLLMVIRHKWY